ncbi:MULTISPECIES: tyrosine-type recombinase/integrase [unclassified Microbacterium]|uniref:tyrosine-type recombinase/integrase n=1 Tax=unclassified Microbacterium TaxID=2609290 RepID=UPI00301821E1
MRGKGEGAIYRVPADKTKPLKYWTGVIELPPGPSGERRRKPVRRKNKAELIAALADMRSKLEKQGDLPTASTTVEKWFTYWLGNIAAKNVRPNTLDGYRRVSLNHIVPAIGKVKLDKVSANHVRRVHDAVIEKGNNSTTALLAHRTMSIAFKAAVREGRIGRNPASLVDAPRRAATKLNALDLPEAIQLLEHLSHREDDGALWATVLLTGARRGEVIGLEHDRVGDVLDLSWQLIRLPLTEETGKPDVPADYEYRHVEGGLYLTRPKSSKGWRIIPLTDPLKSILERHIAETGPNKWGLVFLRTPEPTPKGNPRPKRPYGPDLVGKEWREVLREAGIKKDVRLHDGRHSTVDLLYLAGVPEDLIQEIVGHSTRAQTQGYKSLRNRERLTAAMRQFSALFGSEPRALDAP